MPTSPNPPVRPTSLCVYCGSRTGSDPAHEAAARALGEAIGRRGWRLVYGGGKVGLMGVVADATLQAGGTVLGVIPEHLLKLEVGHGSLTELQVVQTMHERKHLMAEAADAFVALPGGIGTLEELYEVWTWQHLGFHRKPIALLDTRSYYQPLLAFMRHTVEQGFVSPAQAAVPLVASDVEGLLEALERHLGAARPSDYRRI